MANASVICTDETGILTQNMMSVIVGSIGFEMAAQVSSIPIFISYYANRLIA